MAKLTSRQDAVIGKGTNALQGDLFSRRWGDKAPARGNGFHVRLKPLPGDKPVVRGMAAFAGEGPAGKYCKDCVHFGEVVVQRSPDVFEKNPIGCSVYARRTGHAAPMRRRDIRLCAACKYFEPADEATRRFIVDQAGAVHRIEKFPQDIRTWRPVTMDTAVAPADAVVGDESN